MLSEDLGNSDEFSDRNPPVATSLKTIVATISTSNLLKYSVRDPEDLVSEFSQPAQGIDDELQSNKGQKHINSSKTLKRKPSSKNIANLPILKQFSEDLKTNRCDSPDVARQTSDVKSATKKEIQNIPSNFKNTNSPIPAQEEIKNIGSFVTEDYKMIKGYLEGNENTLRLFYTRLDPLGQKTASVCIVHGLGEHSGRYINVKLLIAYK